MLKSGIDAEKVLESAAADGSRWLSLAADSDVVVLAVSTASNDSVFIDLTTVRPQFATLLAELPIPIAAYHAKTVSRGLLTRQD